MTLVATPTGSRVYGRRRRKDFRTPVGYDVIAQNTPSGQRRPADLWSAVIGMRSGRSASARFVISVTIVIIVGIADMLILGVDIFVIRVALVDVEREGVSWGDGGTESMEGTGTVRLRTSSSQRCGGRSGLIDWSLVATTAVCGAQQTVSYSGHSRFTTGT